MYTDKEINDLANYCNIGGKIASICDEDIKEDKYEEIGREYYTYYVSQVAEISVQKVYKRMLLEKDIDILTRFLLTSIQTIDSFISQRLVFKADTAILGIKIYKRIKNGVEKTHCSFAAKDFSRDCDTFVEILTLVSCANNAGRELVKYALNVCKGTPILLEAGYLNYGDYILAAQGNKEATEILNNLISYYKELGFIDVNDKYGCYEEQVTMLNDNKGECV